MRTLPLPITLGVLVAGFVVGLGAGFLVAAPPPGTGATDATLLEWVSESLFGEPDDGDEEADQLSVGVDDVPEGDSPSPAPTATEPGCEPAPLAERAGATLIGGMEGATDADHEAVDALANAQVAGVFLTSANVETRRQVAALVRGLRRALGRDVLVTTDEETGRVSSFRQVLGTTSSPRTSARQLDPATWRERAEELGEALADVGVDWNFAPVADLDGGPPDGVIGDRSFSHDPDRATEFVLAFGEGHARAGVIPTVKHFPGHGSATGDPHRQTAEDPRSLAELRAADLEPFAAAIEAGVPAVMVSHVVHTPLDGERPASLTPETYELLRQLGFEGVAITDSLGMGAVHQHYGYTVAAVDALAAGADALLVSDGRVTPDIVDAIVEAVEHGELAEQRLNDAATRVWALADRAPEPLTCQPAPEGFPSLS